MRYGYWLPVFGGWLRNVEDEHMAASWEYVRTLAKRSEEIGYDITLIAELLLNDAPSRITPSSTPAQAGGRADDAMQLGQEIGWSDG